MKNNYQDELKRILLSEHSKCEVLIDYDTIKESLRFVFNHGVFPKADIDNEMLLLWKYEDVYRKYPDLMHDDRFIGLCKNYELALMIAYCGISILLHDYSDESVRGFEKDETVLVSYYNSLVLIMGERLQGKTCLPYSYRYMQLRLCNLHTERYSVEAFLNKYIVAPVRNQYMYAGVEPLEDDYKINVSIGLEYYVNRVCCVISCMPEVFLLKEDTLFPIAIIWIISLCLLERQDLNIMSMNAQFPMLKEHKERALSMSMYVVDFVLCHEVGHCENNEDGMNAITKEYNADTYAIDTLLKLDNEYDWSEKGIEFRAESVLAFLKMMELLDVVYDRVWRKSGLTRKHNKGTHPSYRNRYENVLNSIKRKGIIINSVYLDAIDRFEYTIKNINSDILVSTAKNLLQKREYINAERIIRHVKEKYADAVSNSNREHD